MNSGNIYVGVTAPDEASCLPVLRRAHLTDGDIIKMVHMEPPTDEEEQPTWIFEVWVDGGEEELREEGEMLSRYYTLPELEDMPFEQLN